MPEVAIAQLYIATGNSDKLREISEILAGYNIKIIGKGDVEFYEDPPETGDTLLENALIKAREGFRRTGLPTLADDSGLEVKALGGKPGVYSSRYAGDNCSYTDNVNKLLLELSGLQSIDRTAKFRCVMALVDGQREYWWEGTVVGSITVEAKGVTGFGYDPVFYSDDLQKTFAESTPSEKNSVSHRGKALRKFAEEVPQIFGVTD